MRSENSENIPKGKPRVILLALLMVLADSASAVESSPAASGAMHGIDSVQIHKLYMDGDFDPAIDILESDLKTLAHLSHNDSIFIFKHLGVMYAANYETRERGKMYMHQLLMTEPTAKIMDMYASDMIYMIFKNMQDEFETNRGRFQPDKEHSHPEDQKPARESNTRTMIWIGAALVSVGVGILVLIASLPSGGSGGHNF